MGLKEVNRKAPLSHSVLFFEGGERKETLALTRIYTQTTLFAKKRVAFTSLSTVLNLEKLRKRGKKSEKHFQEKGHLALLPNIVHIKLNSCLN